MRQFCASHLFVHILLPVWLQRLVPRWRNVPDVFAEFVEVLDVIAESRIAASSHDTSSESSESQKKAFTSSASASSGNDLLSLLTRNYVMARQQAELKAQAGGSGQGGHDEDDEPTGLSKAELLSNVFIFILAGHETSAHTMCFALGMMAEQPVRPFYTRCS
jgi:hypothetical protein